MSEEGCDVFNPCNRVFGELVGELRVGGMVVFDVELVVKFFGARCDLVGFTGFTTPRKDGSEVGFEMDGELAV